MRRFIRPTAGILVAAGLNTLLFWIARSAGLFGPQVIAVAAQAPLTLSHILGASTAGVVGAVALRLVLGALIQARQTARAAFLAVSALVLAFSFASPVVGIRGASPLEISLLEIMHIVVAFAAVAAAEWTVKPDWNFGAAPYRERSIAPRTALVTGATSGIGAQVALELTRRGYQVIGIGRVADKAREVEKQAENRAGSLSIHTGDLSLMTEAKRLAGLAQEHVNGEAFSLVAHCVGTLKPRSAKTIEGLDENFATSFLSRVCITQAVRLAQDARLVNVAAAERGHLPRFMRSEMRQGGDIGTGMKAHGQAQVANDLWTAQLGRSEKSAFGYGPGAVDTAIRRELPPFLLTLMKPLFLLDTRAPRAAALDVVRLLLDADLPRSGFASRDGLFIHDPYILDPPRQDRLLALADQLMQSATARKAENPA